MEFRFAADTDASAITTLLNTAYRGESSRQGWTTEADLLAGLRASTAEVLKQLHAPDSFFLLCLESGSLLGCICLEKYGEGAHLGMFAVQPQRQGTGIGRQLLDFAEQQAITLWHSRHVEMTVITLRAELIDYYLRRGYQRTGVLKPFPIKSALWTPLVSGLQLEVLEKVLKVGDTLYA